MLFRPIECDLISGTIVGVTDRGVSAVIHFRAAIRAENKSGQWICFSCGIRPPDGFSGPLGKLPGFRVNNSLMGVFKNQPFIFRAFQTLLVLVGFLVIAEIDCMTHVFLLGQNIGYCCSTPVVRAGHVCSVLLRTEPTFRHIHRRPVDLVIPQGIRNLTRTTSVDAELEDTLYYRRRFLVHQPVKLVLRVFPVSVDGLRGCWLA